MRSATFTAGSTCSTGCSALIDEDDARARPGARREIIFLGDLVDRGPDSRGVVERLLQLSRAGGKVRFLMGNHEEVFLRAVARRREGAALPHPDRRTRDPAQLRDQSESNIATLDFDELACLLERERPGRACRFPLRLREAGSRSATICSSMPGCGRESRSRSSRASDLCWIRDDFLDHRDSFGKMVVHGHSITDDVDLRANRIGIDTGAFASGRLTAIGLEGDERWFLST